MHTVFFGNLQSGMTERTFGSSSHGLLSFIRVSIYVSAFVTSSLHDVGHIECTYFLWYSDASFCFSSTPVVYCFGMNAPDNLFGWGIDAVFLTRRTFVDALGCIRTFTDVLTLKLFSPIQWDITLAVLAIISITNPSRKKLIPTTVSLSQMLLSPVIEIDTYMFLQAMVS